ncbi:hypothetical protein [Phytobacter sp. RSE-02]|uniref:hypothetical protein n=1 Tax=Phytobacter sp. RSE-02 TaxID=3229229 RepID=UPI000893315A|nr:hypothetical protein C2U55_15585 [Enterobacteriaceae bacterium ENNIH3]AUV09515.1 hypothetical protein C2U52_26310 [Enterobacteriaceae bacterium ENNIH2]PWF51145.1 hypothetical protein BHT19_0009375 [[Kluyvera] intestini]
MGLRQDKILVQALMQKFLTDETIRKKIRFICGKHKNDWEKWLQLEVAYFISQIDGLFVEKEVQAFPDKRMLKNRYNMFIDLAFRQKRTRYNSYIFLEFKCSNNVQPLINGFERDIDKINSIKKCLLDQRSFWCVGFHRNCSDRSISKMRDYVKDMNGFYSVIRLCDCDDDADCECEDARVGFAVI